MCGFFFLYGHLLFAHYKAWYFADIFVYFNAKIYERKKRIKEREKLVCGRRRHIKVG